MRATRFAATAATALLLVTAQPTLTTAESAPTNAVPPPLDRSLLPAHTTPKADLDYARTKPCNDSAVQDEVLTAKPHAQLVLRLDEAHRFATGKGVKIAIIDTGVQPHRRLDDRVEAGGDYVVTADRGLVDCDGHGTEVAGVAAASRDPETGFVGAAPDAAILSIRQTSSFYQAKTASPDGRSVPGAVATLAQSIVHAVESGADVINISLTACGPPKAPGRGERSVQAAIDWAVNTKDVVVVAAAGNIGPEGLGCTAQNDHPDPEDVAVVASPPWYRDDVLSVTSVDRQGRPSEFSVWGPWVSIAAPGEEITTVDPNGEGLTDAANGKRGAIQGTSFAAPYVAGIAALVRELHPELTARQVMRRLTSTAQHPGNTDGRDRKVGAGVIDPVAALTSDLPRERPGAQLPQLPPLTTVLDTPRHPDRTPLVVALTGSGVAALLLLLTAFTVRRVRARRA